MASVSRFLWSAGMLLGSGFWAARGSAAEIDWRAPAACPDAAELRFRVERAIGMPLSHAAPLRFEVEAVPSPQGYMARVDVDSGPEPTNRRRELVAADCSRLADMVTVTVALALGAAGGGAGGEAEPSGGSRRPHGSGATPGAERGAQGSLDRGDAEDAADVSSWAGSWWPAVSLWFLGDTGSLPQPGAGVALGAQVEHAGFQLRALGTLLFEQHEALAVDANPTPGAELGLLAAALSACAARFGSSGGRLTLYGCAGWELGRLSGEGTGVLTSRAGAALWSAPRLDVGASWALGSTGLRLGAMLTLAVPLARDDFVLSDLGSVHRPPGGVGRAAIGLDLALR